MNRIRIAIQGKTLILQYRVQTAPLRDGAGWAHYIRVLPALELSRFDLKGLSPEMFCVNISDMVNNRGLFSGVVENERQLPVARWTMNRDDYLDAASKLLVKPAHGQIVALLASLSTYVEEADEQFIDFEERVVGAPDGAVCGYRLTVVTEDIGDRIAPFAYYSFDVHMTDGWLGCPPPSVHHEAVRNALLRQLHAIAVAGVQLTQAYDETDYAAAG